MNISFKGIVLNVTEVTKDAQYVRRGDFIDYNGSVVWVETVQKGCPSINRYGSDFTSILIVSSEGIRSQVRDLFGPVRVYKKKSARFVS